MSLGRKVALAALSRFLLLPRTIANTGSAGCPCVEWAGLNAYVTTVDGNQVLAVYPYGPDDGPAYHYDVNYGNIECKAHDQGTRPYCHGYGQPRWCSQQWCFINPASCDQSYAKSQFFDSPSDRVYFSYATCGSSNSWESYDFSASGSNVLSELISGVEAFAISAKTAAEGSTSFGSCDGTSSMCDDCTASTCDSSSWSGGNTQYTVDFSRVGILPRGSAGTCAANAVSGTYLNVAGSEYNNINRIAYQYMGLQQGGGFVQWPHMRWQQNNELMCPTTDQFDPRFRPWYVAAATGPKDVVLVVDNSGSMRTPSTRILKARDAAIAVVDTLNEHDYVGIVTFLPIETFSNKLVQANAGNKQSLQSWISNTMVGKYATDFRNSIARGFDMIERAVSSGATSTCSRVMMFLTDGQAEFTEADYTWMKGKVIDRGVILFTYLVGTSGAEYELVPKRLACENQGIFYKVEDNGDLQSLMSSYYEFFNTGAEFCQVRWTEYQDAITGTSLLAGCLPVYDTENKVIRGVTCADLNVVVDLAQLKTYSGYNTFKCQYEQVSKTCAAPYTKLNEALLEQMRATAGGICAGESYYTGSGGDANKCIDKTCQDTLGFLDTAGYPCDAWVGDDCNRIVEQWPSLYTSADQQSIIASCPRSCLRCSWTGNCAPSKCDGVTGVQECRQPRKVGGTSGGNRALVSVVFAFVVPVLSS